MDAGTKRAALREALIEAAERIVAAHGLAAVKARDLAREAGCAVGAIYNVVPDLDALILAVNLRTLTLFEAAIARSLEDAPPLPGGVPGAVDELVRLAFAYLRFAQAHPLRWRTLFRHRTAGGVVPDWYRAEQGRLFRYIEAPLARLCPGLTGEDRALRARSLFSCTHGLVSLGLDERLMALAPEVLAGELEAVVRAMGQGLADGAHANSTLPSR